MFLFSLTFPYVNLLSAFPYFFNNYLYLLLEIISFYSAFSGVLPVFPLKLGFDKLEFFFVGHKHWIYFLVMNINILFI